MDNQVLCQLSVKPKANVTFHIARNFEPKFSCKSYEYVFFNDLSRCQSCPSTGSLSRYTNITVFAFKKEPLNENTVNYSEMCSKLSLEREVLHEIWTIFPGDIEKRISENFAVESILKDKKSKEISIGKCKM